MQSLGWFQVFIVFNPKKKKKLTSSYILKKQNTMSPLNYFPSMRLMLFNFFRGSRGDHIGVSKFLSFRQVPVLIMNFSSLISNQWGRYFLFYIYKMWGPEWKNNCILGLIHPLTTGWRAWLTIGENYIIRKKKKKII